jgi:hypothetical protein
MIINFSFFLILLKIFFLVILNLNNYVAFKIKNYFIYYFIYDIIISILTLTINFIYIKNIILQNLLLNLSVIALIFQSYVFLYIIYFIIKKQEQIIISYKKLFYYYLCIAVAKIVVSFLHNYNSVLFHFDFLFVLGQYKFFFFSNIFFNLLFQYNTQIKCFIDFYQYVKSYKIDSNLKKSFFVFFYTFLIKNILYDYLLIFFDIFSFLNLSHYYFYIIYTFNIYQLLYIISFFSLINYFSIFFVILMAKKEISLPFIMNADSNYSIIFSTSDSYEIIVHDVSFYCFLLKIIKKNINIQFQISDEMNAIILIDNKDYSDLFNEKNIIYKEILKKKIISYDYYYNIVHSYLFIKNSPVYESLGDSINKILLELEKYNIRVISGFYLNNQLNGYLVVFNKSFSVKKILTNIDVSILYNLSNYITFSYEKLTKNVLYTHLNYQKRISEYNLIENNYKYSDIYKKLNEKIKDIKQIFIYENKKKIFKIFSNIEDSEFLNYISDIHKNEQIITSNKLHSKYIFTKIKNNSYSILSSGKIILHKHYASFYTILPFIRKEYGLLYNLYYHDRIDEIFSYDDKYLDKDKIFFSTFDNNFNIKIIMIDSLSNSFFKMISYFSNCIGFDCIYISFKNINDNNFTKILDYYNYILEENKKHYIFFTDIEKESKLYQKHILDRYINYVLNSKNIIIKLFFIISIEEEIKNIHHELIQIAKYITIKINNEKEMKPHFLVIIINNYSNKILNKKFSIDLIEEFIKKKSDEKFHNIYSFIDLFEKNIILESFQDKLIDDSEYIQEGIRLKKESLKNIILMKELLRIYKNNYTKIANLIDVHNSTISRYFKNLESER